VKEYANLNKKQYGVKILPLLSWQKTLVFKINIATRQMLQNEINKTMLLCNKEVVSVSHDSVEIHSSH